jgi:hypothetical protein
MTGKTKVFRHIQRYLAGTLNWVWPSTMPWWLRSKPPFEPPPPGTCRAGCGQTQPCQTALFIERKQVMATRLPHVSSYNSASTLFEDWSA